MVLGLLPGFCLAQRYLPSTDFSRAVAIPEPMKLQWKVREPFPLSATTALVAPAGTSSEVRQKAVEMKRLLTDMFGANPQVLFTDLIPERNVIILGTLQDSLALGGLLPANLRTQLGNFPDQGYMITSTVERVVVVGASPAGLEYGLQTLLQIMSLDASIMKEVVPPLEIIDFPATDMRALLLPFGSYRQLSQMMSLRGLIGVAQMLHMNTLILQVNSATIFDSAPGIARSGATPKDTLRAVVQFAREAGLEVIPLVSTLSQQSALLCTAYPSLCLDKDTYNPANPKVYEKLFGILDEVIEIFQPRYMHIGHDAVLALTKLPEADAQRLFISDVRKIHDHLKTKNVGTMMWADMLLRPEDFPGQDNCRGLLGNMYTVIDSLPKDILLVDAHYRQRRSDYPSVDYLLSKGFQVAGCVGGDTMTVRNFSKYVSDKDVRFAGMILADWDWAKYEGQGMHPKIVWQGAEAFWRGGIPAEDPKGLKKPAGLRNVRY
jgi:hypothetical protein